MKSRQVKWIIRNEADAARRIARLGGDDFDHSIAEAIMNVHHGACSYWMVHEGQAVSIILDTRPGPAYLRTERDCGEPELLLSLVKEKSDSKKSA